MSLRDSDEIVTTMIHYPTLEAYLEQRGITIEQFAEEQAAYYRHRIPVWYKDWIARRNEIRTPPPAL
jgi:deoxyadenosine/deoxycytidine kinase